MVDLILKARLDSLENNFQTLSQIINSISKRRKEITDLQDTLNDCRRRLNSITNKLNNCYDMVDELRQDPIKTNIASRLEDIQTVEDEANKEAAAVRDIIKKAQVNILQKIQERSINLNDERQKGLVATATEEIQKIIDSYKDNVVNNIHKDLETAAHLDGSKADEKRKHAWETYSIQKHMSARQELFEEYVDFLRGLAMREADLDEGICRIAENWSNQLSSNNPSKLYQSFTIPASHEPANISLAHFVHIPFPEWTLWALPLTAHELGHLVVKMTPELDAFANMHDKKPLHMREFMADIFGTFTMGPAYAFACVLLRFEPPTAYNDKDEVELPSDAKRARVIFDTLNRIEKSYSCTFNETENLQKEWELALDQSNNNEVKQKAQADIDEISTLLNSLENENLLKRLNSVGYSAEKWEDVKILRNQILTNLNKDESQYVFNVGGVTDLRDVVNAAWLCRIKDLENEKVTNTENIRQVAQALWQKIEEQRSKITESRESTSFRTEAPRRG